MMTMALHSQWMGVEVDTVHATGGAAANRGDPAGHGRRVPGADVYQFEVGNSAALGAALRAAESRCRGARPRDSPGKRWCARPPRADRSQPNRAPDRRAGGHLPRPDRHLHAACEAHALGRGPAPATAASPSPRHPPPERRDQKLYTAAAARSIPIR